MKLGSPRKDCPDCMAAGEKLKPKSVYMPRTHCTTCLYSVTHTKLGVCITLLWGDDNVVLPIDLIPVFPVKARNTLELFEKVTKTLTSKRPPFWLKHFIGVIERDRMLPEQFQESLENAEGEAKVFDACFKLLNYGARDNFIVRPAQQMELQQFKRADLKAVYCSVKCLKDLLGIDIKSYFIKKVILSRLFIHQESRLYQRQILHNVLSYPEIKRSFEIRVDYDAWDPRELLSLDIPLKPKE